MLNSVQIQARKWNGCPVLRQRVWFYVSVSVVWKDIGKFLERTPGACSKRSRRLMRKHLVELGDRYLMPLRGTLRMYRVMGELRTFSHGALLVNTFSFTFPWRHPRRDTSLLAHSLLLLPTDLRHFASGTG